MTLRLVVEHFSKTLGAFSFIMLKAMSFAKKSGAVANSIFIQN
jgi:hypothetical protein